MREISLLVYIENKVKDIDLEVEKLIELGNTGVDVQEDLMDLLVELDSCEALLQTLKEEV